jgi:hypothetical protein
LVMLDFWVLIPLMSINSGRGEKYLAPCPNLPSYRLTQR